LDLFDLLIERGADLNGVDVYAVLETYNVNLYERCRAAGYDLTQRHEMGSILGHGSSNRPLLGFAKRHRLEDPGIQQELDIALACQARRGSEKGVNLCLWAGADPHARVPDPDSNVGQVTEPEYDDEVEEDTSPGWSAIEEAASAGQASILKRLGPDPNRDDFDNLYRYAKDESIIIAIMGLQPPKDLTSILSWHVSWLGDRFPGLTGRSSRTIEAILQCGTQWSEPDAKRLADIRRWLLHAGDYELKPILALLIQSEVCAPETYRELVRTPRMQARLVALGLARKPINQREQRTAEFRQLMSRYDRKDLFDHVWARPVPDVANSLRISSARFRDICRKLHVPIPLKGHWALLKNGLAVKKPPLPKLNANGKVCRMGSRSKKESRRPEGM
jgi:hypothetical protein